MLVGATTTLLSLSGLVMMPLMVAVVAQPDAVAPPGLNSQRRLVIQSVGCNPSDDTSSVTFDPDESVAHVE